VLNAPQEQPNVKQRLLRRRLPLAIGPVCTVCNADAVLRRIGEQLLRMHVSIRDVTEFSKWWVEKHGLPKVLAKSAWHRHKLNGHFSMLDGRPEIEREVQSLQDLVADMFKRFQAGNKGYVPTHQEMREWLTLEARIADLQQRREDERNLRQLVAGMSYAPPKTVEVVRVENGAPNEMGEPTEEEEE